MRKTLAISSIIVTALAFGVTPLAAQQSTPLSKAEEDAVRALILQTIQENPKAILDSIIAFQKGLDADAERRQREAIVALGEELRSDPDAPVLGNPDGGTVMVEFFDYNCPYCRRAAPEVMALITADSDIRVVMREWPILGPDSELAARASLAARAQGKYAAFHKALMAQPRANALTIRQSAEAAGLDYDRLQADMSAAGVDAHIARSRDLAEALGVRGTPTFIVGETLVPGFADKGQLAALIAGMRNTAKGQ